MTINGNCDICGKARNRQNDHSACSALRKAQGFPGKKSEGTRLGEARRVAKKYASGDFKFPD